MLRLGSEVCKPTLVDLTEKNDTRESAIKISVEALPSIYLQYTRLWIIGNSRMEEEDSLDLSASSKG